MSDLPSCVLAKNVIHILNTKGWTKGTFKNMAGEYCLVGAICAVVPEPDYSRASEFLQLLTHKQNVASLTDWNDAPDRTKEDVIELLESVCTH